MVLSGIWRDATVYLSAVCDVFGARTPLRLKHWLCIGGDADPRLNKSASARESVSLRSRTTLVSAQTSATGSSLIALRDKAMLSLRRFIGGAPGSVKIDAHAQARCVHLRTLGELEAVTMADITPWNMDQFYYLEV